MTTPQTCARCGRFKRIAGDLCAECVRVTHRQPRTQCARCGKPKKRRGDLCSLCFCRNYRSGNSAGQLGRELREPKIPTLTERARLGKPLFEED